MVNEVGENLHPWLSKSLNSSTFIPFKMRVEIIKDE